MQDIHHVVDIEAPRARVFEALTTEKGLSSWWTTNVRTDQASVGSRIIFTFGTAGEVDERGRVSKGFSPEMRVNKREPDVSVEWECVGGAEQWLGARISFGLADERPGVTRLRFTQGYASSLLDDDFGVYNYNWAYYLESLRLLCAEGAGNPFEAG